MNMQRVLLMALYFISGLGPITILKILKLYPDLEQLLRDLENNQINPKMNVKLFEKIQTNLDIKETQKVIAQCQYYKINILTYIDKEYPYLLKQIFDPPIILYYQGDLNCFSALNYLAVVGTRKISSYAKQIMPNLLKPIIDKNIIIVSGLALGIDSLAHQITVNNKQPTIAVLGSGINQNSLYPRQNYRLTQDIIKNNGLLISEYPPETEPIPENFPKRNRIISGLCQATLIIEAAERSGSLITAYQALEQNREIMAVPGNIYLTNSQGTNKLLQRGARLITQAADVLDIYSISQDPHHNETIQNLTPVEQNILKLLLVENLTVDKLQQKSKIDIAQLNAALGIMEVKGLIKSSGGNYYSL